jgi:hypothetical protein
MVLGASFRRAEKVCPACAAVHRFHEDQAHEAIVKQLQN